MGDNTNDPVVSVMLMRLGFWMGLFFRIGLVFDAKIIYKNGDSGKSTFAIIK
jgi:hypothetical protein